MTEAFTATQKERLRKLLLLAAESPFEGERAAALAAAERLAGRFGMSLEEAAGASAEPEPKARRASAAEGAGARRRAPEWMYRAASGYAYEASAAASRARQRHREQVAAAQRREEEERRQARTLGRRWGGARSERRMAPRDFARRLIEETAFTLPEIAEITGLTQHELVGLKLKLRG